MLENLINSCKQNDPKAQEQIYKLLAPKLFAVCLKYSRSYEEAQDNFQESLLLVFQKINQFENKGSFEGWAKRLVINFVLMQYRSKTTMFEIINDKLADNEVPDWDEEDLKMEDLLKYIQELPDRYRLVFNLYVLDGYSHKEIAALLDINEGTSKSNLARAKMILQEKLVEKKISFKYR